MNQSVGCSLDICLDRELRVLARGKPAAARQSYCWGSQVSGGHPGQAPSSLIRSFSLASIIHSYTEARVLFLFANPNTLPAENTPRIRPRRWVHHPLLRHPSPILSSRLVSPELSFLLLRSPVPFKAGLSSHSPHAGTPACLAGCSSPSGLREAFPVSPHVYY